MFPTSNAIANIPSTVIKDLQVKNPIAAGSTKDLERGQEEDNRCEGLSGATEFGAQANKAALEANDLKSFLKQSGYFEEVVSSNLRKVWPVIELPLQVSV